MALAGHGNSFKADGRVKLSYERMLSMVSKKYVSCHRKSLWNHTKQVEVTYEWMRGTVDEGAYISPSRVVINRRKLRALMVRSAALGCALSGIIEG